MQHELVAYIPFFIDQLKHLHPEHRDLAADELAAIGLPAIPALQREAYSESYFARLGAIDALCKMNTGPARDVLLRVLDSTAYADVRRLILKHMVAYRRDSHVGAVLLRVARKDAYIMWWVRRMGIENTIIRSRIASFENVGFDMRERILKEIRAQQDGTTLQILRQLLLSEDATLREFGAFHLANEDLYGDHCVEPRQFARARSVQALMDALNDESESNVRLMMVRSIGTYIEFTMQITIALKLSARSDPDERVRTEAQSILNGIGATH